MIRSGQRVKVPGNGKLTVEYMRTVRRIVGHTVGVLGFGDIGRAFANRIRGLDHLKSLLTILRASDHGRPLWGKACSGRTASESDYVSIHTALTDETRYMINEDSLKLMKPMILVNTSRGPVVDGVALP